MGKHDIGVKADKHIVNIITPHQEVITCPRCKIDAAIEIKKVPEELKELPEPALKAVMKIYRNYLFIEKIKY